MTAQPMLFPEHPIMQRVKDTLKTDKVRFDGQAYSPKHDDERLSGQILRVYDAMKDGNWRTLDEIHVATGGDPHASISAQLRHLRKKKFGSHQVEKRPRGDRSHGLFEYRLIVKE